jgi:hypothetical protein
MPSYIIKINKEDDFYCLWSEVTESPHVWGTRAEVEEYMIHHHAMAGELQERFDRADLNGTSAFSYAENYGWEDKGIFIYEQKGMLRRERLGDFLNSFDGKYSFDLTILEPFDSEEN